MGTIQPFSPGQPISGATKAEVTRVKEGQTPVTQMILARMISPNKIRVTSTKLSLKEVINSISKIPCSLVVKLFVVCIVNKIRAYLLATLIFEKKVAVPPSQKKVPIHTQKRFQAASTRPEIPKAQPAKAEAKPSKGAKAEASSSHRSETFRPRGARPEKSEYRRTPTAAHGTRPRERVSEKISPEQLKLEKAKGVILQEKYYKKLEGLDLAKIAKDLQDMPMGRLGKGEVGKLFSRDKYSGKAEYLRTKYGIQSEDQAEEVYRWGLALRDNNPPHELVNATKILADSAKKSAPVKSEPSKKPKKSQEARPTEARPTEEVKEEVKQAEKKEQAPLAIEAPPTDLK